MNRNQRKVLQGEVNALTMIHDNIREIIDNAAYDEQGVLMPRDYFVNERAVLEGFRDDIETVRDNVADMASEEEEKLENMSDGLREGPTGEVIQEALDNLNLAVESMDNAILDAGTFLQVTKTDKSSDNDLEAQEGYLSDMADALSEAIDSINSAIG